MAERIGKFSTVRGMELRNEHDERYKKMLIGKRNDIGLIVDAKWIGNSVYGIVKLTFEDGSDKLYSSLKSFRPRKSDFNLSDGVV